MRKLKLQVQVSADGFVGGPKGELDWMTWDWDDQLKDYVSELHTSIDTILLGKNMTDGFVKHWEMVKGKPDDPSHEFGKLMVDTPKIVFSRTLKESQWNNTELAKGDYVEVINKLKNKPGKDIIVYGGSNFVSSLIKADLIDEYNLFVNPTAIGGGLEIFGSVGSKKNLKLVKAAPFSCGVAALQYQPVR